MDGVKRGRGRVALVSGVLVWLVAIGVSSPRAGAWGPPAGAGAVAEEAGGAPEAVEGGGEAVDKDGAATATGTGSVSAGGAVAIGPEAEPVEVFETDAAPIVAAPVVDEGAGANEGLDGAADGDVGGEGVADEDGEAAEATATVGAAAVIESRPLGAPPVESAGEDGVAPGLAVVEDLGLVRMVASVGVVIGLILVARWVTVRAARRAGGGLRGQLGAGGMAPSGILQVLGRYPVGRGQTLVLLKLDRRVLLLSQTSSGFATLAEIDEAEEVASILTKARDEEGESLSARFSALLGRLERDPETASGDDVEIAPYLRRPSLEEIEGAWAGSEESGPPEDEADPGEALRRRLADLRGLSA